MINLLTRGLDRSHDLGKIEDRDLLYEAQTKAASLFIFDGGHEMRAEWCFDRLTEIADEQTASD